MKKQISALVALGSLLVGPVSRAGFDSNNSTALTAVAKAQAAAQAKVRADVAMRQAYYSVHYDNENGGYGDYAQALNEGLVALSYLQAQNDGKGELGIMIYQDAYGLFWYTNPVMGQEQPDGSWLTMQNTAWIQRPGSHILSSAHTHPNNINDGLGMEIDTDGDNQSNHPMFVIRADDTIWYFKPLSHQTKLYGKILDGQVVTKYNKTENLDDDTYDPYAVAANTGQPSDGSGSVLLEAGAVAFIGAALLTGLILGGGSSGISDVPAYSDSPSRPVCEIGTHLDPITNICTPGNMPL